MKSKNIYQIPFKEDELFLALSDPRAHSQEYNNENAIDFIISPKTEILAALDGEVVNVKDDANEGGADEKFAVMKYQNYITIKHENGEYSQYIHVAQNSSLVKKGDKIKKGHVIAKGIGMIGYTTFPHLHFEIFDEDEKSLEINFEGDSFKIYGEKSFHEEIVSEGVVKPKYKLLVKECEELMKNSSK